MMLDFLSFLLARRRGWKGCHSGTQNNRTGANKEMEEGFETPSDLTSMGL